MKTPEEIFRELVVGCYVRPTDMQLSMERHIAHFSDHNVSVDADFYASYFGRIVRLEIKFLDKNDFQSDDYDVINRILLEGYNTLKTSGELDKLMTMHLYL